MGGREERGGRGDGTREKWWGGWRKRRERWVRDACRGGIDTVCGRERGKWVGVREERSMWRER